MLKKRFVNLSGFTLLKRMIKTLTGAELKINMFLYAQNASSEYYRTRRKQTKARFHSHNNSFLFSIGKNHLTQVRDLVVNGGWVQSTSKIILSHRNSSSKLTPSSMVTACLPVVQFVSPSHYLHNSSDPLTNSSGVPFAYENAYQSVPWFQHSSPGLFPSWYA